MQDSTFRNNSLPRLERIILVGNLTKCRLRARLLANRGRLGKPLTDTHSTGIGRPGSCEDVEGEWRPPRAFLRLGHWRVFARRLAADWPTTGSKPRHSCDRRLRSSREAAGTG
jgi:hypothetical protein